MGELYNPYPKLPKNIRQIGERDQIVKLYVEDYVNTYLKRLYPTGGQDLKVGLLLGEIRSQEGIPYLFVDGAMEMEDVAADGERAEFTESAWKKAYQVMEQMFPRRSVIGWFICGAPGSNLSPLNYWRQHGQYFSAKNQLMYLNSGLEGEEAIYTASEDGFYRLRGYCVYYERNQMMQDYMVSRKDARRVESGTRDVVIRDFRQRLEDKKVEANKTRSTVSILGTVCGMLAVMVLAGGVAMFNNYQKMRAMESVIASVIPEGTAVKNWSQALTKGKSGTKESDELLVEQIPGEVYPVPQQPEIVIETGSSVEIAESGSLESQVISSEIQNAGQSGNEIGQSGVQGGNFGAQSDEQPEEQAEPVQVPADAVLHVVQSGETLYGICMERYHSMAPLAQICEWNRLDDENRIATGQELYLPSS